MSDAPRVSQADVDRAIVKETYTLLPNGRTTVCQLTLDNGFTVEGSSACVSLENFNETLGNRMARVRAVEEVWQVLGFRLADRLMANAGTGITEVPTPNQGPKVTPAPSQGRIVLYTLTDDDAIHINSRERLIGHGGNSVYGGQTFPAIIVKLDTPELITVQVFVDGPYTYWNTSVAVADGPTPGSYHWMAYQLGK